MKLSLRFILPLILVLAGIAYAVVPFADQLTLRWFVRDLEMRATLVVNTIQEPLSEQLAMGAKGKVVDLFNKLTWDERIYAVAYCPSPTSKPLASRLLPPEVRCDKLDRFNRANNHLLQQPQGLLHVTVVPMASADTPEGQLVLVHDMSFVERRSEETRRYLFYFFIGLAAVISLLTVIIAQLSWRGWVQGMRALMRGEGLLRRPETQPKAPPELRPLARDLQKLVQGLESEVRSRDESQISWTPGSLRAILHGELRGENVIVVSNREPYIHEWHDEKIEAHRPASGLVTALEPIMRACSGTWIAHGSGPADREVVDAQDRVRVPPDKPSYNLRRIWLSAEEETGYYYGFANEGLWPLCHNAHVRPTFRSADWKHYVAVNRKFAKAVVEEAGTPAPIVLVQDYHLALVPRMIREELPEATIITFWHIPWPNQESFSICPWREEILSGLLGSSILGFHTQTHCNNFVDTVDRLLEARVDRDAFTVSLGGELTAVHRYPISITWPPDPELLKKPIAACREEVRLTNGLPKDHLLGIGVDRLDYTKGIIERFRAVERLLELQPEWIGRFSFIQIAAPSRSKIDEYQSYEAQVRALAQAINERFTTGHPDMAAPILLKIEHHDTESVYMHYRAADLCFVSSLHDGMNLVAKEFIAAHDDERGVLILSQFAGAASELAEALIVNPYDMDQCAAALHLALAMPESEQRDRMRLMRALVREFNIYRWAGRMLLDAARTRRHLALKQSGPPRNDISTK